MDIHIAILNLHNITPTLSQLCKIIRMSAKVWTSWSRSRAFSHSPTMVQPTRILRTPSRPKSPSCHSLRVALVYATLDLLKEAAVGVPSGLVFLPLQDPGVADGQLPARTLGLVLHGT